MTRKRKPIAVINTGPITPELGVFYDACGGDNDKLFAQSCGLACDDLVSIEVQDGEALPEPEKFAGVIITGSASMVTELEPWAERCVEWVRASEDRVPMLGVCYGHQLIAHALGGEVGWNAAGPEYGTVDVSLTSDARADTLMDGLPERFLVQAAHHQTVKRLPPGSVLLAEGVAGVHAARFSARTWGVQFHPEYDQSINVALLQEFRGNLTRHGFDVDAAIAAAAPSPQAVRVLTKFAALCGLARAEVKQDT
jgi:GMP synthase (glutamine-hydrolysing)